MSEITHNPNKAIGRNDNLSVMGIPYNERFDHGRLYVVMSTTPSPIGPQIELDRIPLEKAPNWCWGGGWLKALGFRPMWRVT